MKSLAVLPLAALPLPLPASLLVTLDPATAVYDGLAIDDGGTSGGNSGIGAPVLADGFAFNLTFVPEVADLTGTVMLMEVGGTSNGFGLYLADGVPTFIGKQDTNDATLPISLNDTALPAIAVQTAIGKLTAGNESSLASTWDHAGTLTLAVYDGPDLVTQSFTLTGTPGDWPGNESLSVGIKSNNGSTGGLSGDGANPDEDAYSNFEEYLIQHDPRLAEPHPTIRILANPGGGTAEFLVPEPLTPDYAWSLGISSGLGPEWHPLAPVEVRMVEGPLFPSPGTPLLRLSPLAPWPGTASREFIRARLGPISP